MAGKRDIAWVADQVVTTMQSKLVAKLDELDAEYDDGIVLEDIPNDLMFTSEKLNPVGFPLFAVLGERTDLHPFDGQERYGIEHHFLTVAVALISRGEPEEILSRRTKRTIRAIEEVFIENRTLLDVVNDVVLLDKEYSPIVAEENNPNFMQEGQIRIRVETM